MHDTRHNYPEQPDAEKIHELEREALLQYLQCDDKGLTTAEAEARLAHYGPNAIQERRRSPLLKFLAYFWGPIAWMIEVAAILSAVVQNYEDMAIVLLLLVFNAVVGFWQEYQAGNAIEQLKKNLALQARVYRDRQWQSLPADQLVPGDLVKIRLGDVTPADAVLLDGDYLSMDQSALTGESLPVDKRAGDIVYSSSIAKQGEMTCVVTSTGAHTYFGKTARLVSTAGSVSHFRKAVIQIGDYLIFISLLLVTILVVVGLERKLPVIELVEYALILTVASIPVALPAVLSVTMAVGAVKLAKMKAIVSRLEAIEELAGMDILCSDKTGTLTQNRLTLGEPVLFPGCTAGDMALAAVLACDADNPDAIDAAILQAFGHGELPQGLRRSHFTPFDPVSKRSEAEVTAADGRTFKISKGAPQVILDLCHPDAGLRILAEQTVNEFAGKGYRALGVAQTTAGGGWRFLGIQPLFDPPREDAAATIQAARRYGVDIKMVTGDNLAIARQIAGELGLGQNILLADQIIKAKDNEDIVHNVALCAEQADGFAQVFPEHKYWLVKDLQDNGHLVGMTGDGVNDAPALKQADVGIAVSGATDAARAAADLVLTDAGLSVITRAIEEARCIFERMNSYAIYRITETIRIMVFMVAAILIFNFYPITSVMIIVLALLNDVPILTIAKDNTWLPPAPVRWDMRKILTLSTSLGLIGVIETFLLLIIARDYFQVALPELQTVIFLKLSVAGHLTLFVARSRQFFVCRPFPAPILLSAIFGTQLLAVLIARSDWLFAPLSWEYIGLIWVYCLAWVLIEDALKLWIYRRLENRDNGMLRHIRIDLPGKRVRHFKLAP